MLQADDVASGGVDSKAMVLYLATLREALQQPPNAMALAMDEAKKQDPAPQLINERSVQGAGNMKTVRGLA